MTTPFRVYLHVHPPNQTALMISPLSKWNLNPTYSRTRTIHIRKTTSSKPIMTNSKEFWRPTKKTSDKLHFSQVTIEDLISAELHDAFCSELHRKIDGREIPPFLTDNNGLLVLTANTNAQIVIPHSRKQLMLAFSHYPLLVGHPSGSKLYFRLKQHFYWPTLAMDCCANVRNCPECARNLLKLCKHFGYLKMFPSLEPL